MSSAGGARKRCLELPLSLRPREPIGVHDDALGVVVGRALVRREVERNSQVVRAEFVLTDPRGEEVRAVGGGEHDISLTRVPEQKMNQSPPNRNCSAPTLWKRLAVSSVPPITAPARPATKVK